MYNEQQLIQELINTSTREKAFETLVREFQEQLYWQIRRMVIDHDDTDDILQNVFMKAWLGLDNFRGDARLSTWLYRIANNESINFIERQKRKTLSLSNSENFDASDIRIQLESDPYFDGDETEIQLQQAIQSLPPKQRQVFNMKYFQEMKYEDISDILGTSIGALKASYHHAVQKITNFFDKLE
ncbi:MAG: RNA polymerase sigma factor [Bacteroidaceae bacterium]|nr:RNA polymerase sigma factor [Bacteroidaceae bacterium]